MRLTGLDKPLFCILDKKTFQTEFIYSPRQDKSAGLLREGSVEWTRK